MAALLSSVIAVVALQAAAQAPGRAQSPNPDVYMAFGDSITDGAGSTDENGFRALLEVVLRVRRGKASVVNEGVGGADTRRGVRTIQAALERHHPGTTIVLLGTNDWTDDGPALEGTARRLRQIVRAVKASGSVVLIATIPPTNTGFDETTPASRNEWVLRENALIREMALEEGAALADVHAALLAAGPLPELMSDGLHPNDRGYAVIARVLGEALAPGPAR